MLYIIVCNDKKRKEELYINNDIMKEVEEKISTLTECFDKELYYDRELMLKDALSVDNVIKYTGLFEEEINNLKNN